MRIALVNLDAETVARLSVGTDGEEVGVPFLELFFGGESPAHKWIVGVEPLEVLYLALGQLLDGQDIVRPDQKPVDIG